MVASGFSKTAQVLLYNPRRGNSSNDWSDPDDFMGTDTVRFYCDADRPDDSGDGLTTATAKKTTPAILALFRAGQISVPGRPDQVLFKVGTTGIYEEIGYLTTNGTTSGGAQSIHGRSATQRIVFGTYGVGDRADFTHDNQMMNTAPNIGSLTGNNNIAVLGIKFALTGGTVAYGINVNGHMSNWLIENCEFAGFYASIQMSPVGIHTRQDIVIRRNVFHDATSRFIRLAGTQGVLIEENHFNNLNNSNTNGRSIEGIASAKNVEIRGNTFTNYGNRAIWMAAGCIAHKNVIVKGLCGIQVGNSYGAHEGNETALATGITLCDVRGNYVGEGQGSLGAIGIWIQNVKWFGAGDRPMVANNIIAKSTGTSPTNYGIYINGSGTNGAGINTFVSGLTVQRNKIYKWLTMNNSVGIAIASTNTPGQDPDIFDVDTLGNDVQEPLATTGYLVRLFDTSLVPQVDSEMNRFWRGGSATDRFNWGAGASDFQGFAAQLGDTTSMEVQVAYPAPDLTLGDYHGTLGGTATLAAYVTAAMAQSRSSWNDDLMAEKALDYFEANYDA